MMQDALFHESVYDALRAIVERAGGAKAVGARLRPLKAPDEAGRWVLDCLNPSRAERFDPEDMIQMLRIGREVSYHGAKHWIDGETGYAPSMPVEPLDERDALQREYIESVKAAQRIAARLERLAIASNVKAVA
jgi:hypothetical protein